MLGTNGTHLDVGLATNSFTDSKLARERRDPSNSGALAPQLRARSGIQPRPKRRARPRIRGSAITHNSWFFNVLPPGTVFTLWFVVTGSQLWYRAREH